MNMYKPMIAKHKNEKMDKLLTLALVVIKGLLLTCIIIWMLEAIPNLMKDTEKDLIMPLKANLSFVSFSLFLILSLKEVPVNNF